MKNQWDEKYAQPDFAYGKKANDFLVQEWTRLPKNGSILSLAEGEGRNAVFLAEQGFRVTAVDSSSVGLQKARQLATERDVEITTIVADLAEYKIEENYWDGIVSIFCHMPENLRKQVNRSIVKGLRPGGVLIQESYTKQQLEYKTGGPPVPELLYTLDELKEDYQGLTHLYGQEIVREIIEGKSHHGPGAVVQIIGEK